MGKQTVISSFFTSPQKNKIVAVTADSQDLNAKKRKAAEDNPALQQFKRSKDEKEDEDSTQEELKENDQSEGSGKSSTSEKREEDTPKKSDKLSKKAPPSDNKESDDETDTQPRVRRARKAAAKKPAVSDDDDDGDYQDKGHMSVDSDEDDEMPEESDEDNGKTTGKGKGRNPPSKASPVGEKPKGKGKGKGKAPQSEFAAVTSPLFAASIGQFTSPTKQSDAAKKLAAAPSPVSLGKWDPKSSAAAKYTPLEKQVIEFKMKHPGVLLLIEVGYKFRFFGEDAELAAKELNVVAWMDKNFMTASIPTHRLRVHVGRLVAAGYKVGVITQTETAALKAAGGSNKGPFERKLTAVYTKSTMIDDMEIEAGEDAPAANSSSKYLMAIYEEVKSSKSDDEEEKVTFGVVAVQPSSGDIVFDEFVDGRFRGELETRILHLQPSELLLPPSLSRPTEKLISFVASRTQASGDEIRIERTGKPFPEYDVAFKSVSDFYETILAKAAPAQSSSSSSSTPKANVAAKIFGKAISSPRHTIVALAAMIAYLKEFTLDSALQLTQNFSPFSSHHHMLLNGNTLANLEILCNDTDYSSKGSLLWVLDHTVTSFGKRTLKKWVSKPLVDPVEITRRLEAVAELRLNDSTWVKMLDALLQGLPDLERGLSRIHYKKSNAKEVYSVLGALNNISQTFPSLERKDMPFTSDLICELLSTLPSIKGTVAGLFNSLNKQAVGENQLENLFSNSSLFPDIQQYKNALLSHQEALDQHLVEIRSRIQIKDLQYKTVSNEKYLIEVSNSKKVPDNWVKISGTKQVSRYRTSTITQMLKEIACDTERLAIAASSAFQRFLEQIAEHYEGFREVVRAVASLDCLKSLATVASQPGYVKPEMVSYEESLKTGSGILVKEGRHPMVENLLESAFVANDIELRDNGRKCFIITGPNMGGKSSYIRQVALISIMGQIGSFVPAKSATLRILDAVHTRMGASDNLARGSSTFMTEMQETADIIKQVSPKSLVILDELGRGTSTHDGVAIAFATLQYFVVDVNCFTLFVTHYPSLAQIQEEHPASVGNFHMSFVTADEGDDSDAEKITFLYKLVEGAAHRSYGLNVARLADLPNDVLVQAKVKSRELETEIHQRNAEREGEKPPQPSQQGSSNLSLFKDTIRLLNNDDHVERPVLGSLQKLIKGA